MYELTINNQKTGLSARLINALYSVFLASALYCVNLYAGETIIKSERQKVSDANNVSVDCPTIRDMVNARNARMNNRVKEYRAVGKEKEALALELLRDELEKKDLEREATNEKN